MTGDGDHDFVKVSGKDLRDHPDASSFAFESGTPLQTEEIPKLKSPVDIAFTCDNSTIIYLNSLDNNIVYDPHEDDGTSEWKTLETRTGVELQTGLNTFAMEGWNGPAGHGDVDGTSGDGTSPIMYVGAIRGADGNVVVLSPDSAMRIDTNGSTGYTSSNPYGVDYADPEFDDSGWKQPVYPEGDGQRVSQMNWQGSPTVSDPEDDGLDPVDFYGGDPYFTNHIENDDPRVGAGFRDRYWFFRWTVDNTA